MNWILLTLLIWQSPAKTAQAIAVDNYLFGSADSQVKLELFSDFQCPSCRAFYLETVVELIKAYQAGNRVAFVFREFPLAPHPVARVAARYSVASMQLGHDKWLQVIDYLYICQAEWSYDGDIERVLSRILTAGEMGKVKEKLNDPAIEQAIDRDVALGNKKGVASTPTFFLTAGGKEQKVVGGLAFPILKDYIDRYLK